MSKIAKSQIEHLAQLARLELAKPDQEKFSRQIAAILDHVGELAKVNTESVEPITQIAGLANIFREDGDRIESETLARSEALKNAADQQAGYVKMRAIKVESYAQ